MRQAKGKRSVEERETRQLENSWWASLNPESCEMLPLEVRDRGSLPNGVAFGWRKRYGWTGVLNSGIVDHTSSALEGRVQRQQTVLGDPTKKIIGQDPWH